MPSKMQNMAKLTKHIRLVVYSYLTHNEAASRTALLSKHERFELENSVIARDGKIFELSISEKSRPESLVEDDRLAKFLKRIRT